MNLEQAKDLLIEKLEHEYTEYKNNIIKNCNSEEIIEKSYETTFKEQIKDIVPLQYLDKKEIKALLKTDNILNELYKKWEHTDCNIWERLEEDLIPNGIEEIVTEYEKKKEKVR